MRDSVVRDSLPQLLRPVPPPGPDSDEFSSDPRIALADREGFEARREDARQRGRLRGLGFALFQEPELEVLKFPVKILIR